MKTRIKICIIRQLNVVDRWVDALWFNSALHRLKKPRDAKCTCLGISKAKGQKSVLNAL